MIQRSPFSGTEIVDKNNTVDELSESAQNSFVEFNKKLKSLFESDGSFSEKMDILVKLQSDIAPLIFMELISPIGSVDKSMIAARASSVLKEISQTLVKKYEAEVKDELEVNSPKFQLVFGWIIELFSEVLHNQKLDDITINNIFNALASELVGWEDTVAKRLKGLSRKALASAENPFITEFKNKLKK